jgi:hypothetical protein
MSYMHIRSRIMIKICCKISSYVDVFGFHLVMLQANVGVMNALETLLSSQSYFLLIISNFQLQTLVQGMKHSETVDVREFFVLRVLENA